MSESPPATSEERPVKMITVRMSEEEHRAVKRRAWQRKMSLNKHCVDVLMAEADLVEHAAATETKCQPPAE